MVIALVAGFLGLLCALMAVGGNRSGVIRNRSSLRAWLSMPKAFRAFCVEKHVKPGDDFVYMASDGTGSLRRWHLLINTVSEHRKHWENAFDNYVGKLRFKKSGSYQRGPNKLFIGYRISNNDFGWLIFEDAGGSDDLRITFMYLPKPGGTGIRKYMSLIALHVRRFWYSLRGYDTSLNSITRAS